ncbi:MAG: putative Sco1/SenC family protein [Frankiales bacterium]|nr:putative Sco1/SenC family protein [Frankiales bacterium]
MRLLLALLLVLALGGCKDDGPTSPSPTGPAQAYHGVEPSPVPSRPSYVLTDTDGKRFDFLAETKGRPTFVYFGYTHCPDECPTAMADIAAALRKATPELRAATRVVFVTTDPKRDTAPVLRRWLNQFSTGFIGLLGTDKEVAAAQVATGVTPAFPDGLVPTLPGKPNEHVHKPGTAPHKHFGPLGYAVTHSAVIFAYDADDRLTVVYPGGVTTSDIAADLPALAHP